MKPEAAELRELFSLLAFSSLCVLHGPLLLPDAGSPEVLGIPNCLLSYFIPSSL